MHAPKNGFFYVLDRKTGELLSADPWVPVNWASGVDLKTGRPRVNPEARYGEEKRAVMPGPGGGHVWPPWSFNPTTRLGLHSQHSRRRLWISSHTRTMFRPLRISVPPDAAR